MSFLGWLKRWKNAGDGGNPNTQKEYELIGGVETGGGVAAAGNPTTGLQTYPLRVNDKGEIYINVQNPIVGNVSVQNPFLVVKPFTPTVRSGYVLNTTNIPAAPIKIGSGVIRRITMLTTGTSTQRAYLKLYNKITAPTVADIPIFEALFTIGSTTTTISLDVNLPFATGLHMAINGAANFIGAATPVNVANNYFFVIEYE